MTLLRIDELHLENFRCFERIHVPFEPDLTVFFGENAGGKTALLTALAMALDLLQPRHTKLLALNAERDARRIRATGGQREPAGACTVACIATIGDRSGVEWSATASPTSRRRTSDLGSVSEAIEQVREPGERWPLLGYYGTGRLSNERRTGRKAQEFQDRWDGYAGCLDPSATDAPLLDWLKGEVFGDLVRHRRGEPERRFDQGVLDAIKRATPGVDDLWYDPALEGPVTRFTDGSESTWLELSDGYHVFMGLVGDIARRAVILNARDASDAPLRVEGAVLIDEIDLHLHPSWQRTVLSGLRQAFPKLQLIVTTHSPQVLGSVENRQARRLVDWRIREQSPLVEGRDSNSILHEMGDVDRDKRGELELRELYALIDQGSVSDAREQLESLKRKWGGLDPELIRAEGLLADFVPEEDD